MANIEKEVDATSIKFMTQEQFESETQKDDELCAVNIGTSPSFKNQIIEFSIPDYSSGVSLQNSIAVPNSGIILVQYYNNSTAVKKVSYYLNGIYIGMSYGYNTDEAHIITIPVQKGDVFNYVFTSGSPTVTLTFYPFKGAL